jgi:transposase
VSVEVVSMTRKELMVEREQLHKELTALEVQKKHLEAENQWLKEQIGLARHRQFGSSSEKHSEPVQSQMLFNEAEATADSSPEPIEPVETETISYSRKAKSVGHRQEMIKDLPTETIEYRLPEEEQACSQCGSSMHEMSTQVREELVIVPAQAKIVRHVRYVYGCRHCDKDEISTPIVTADAPKPIIAKSLASASAIAYIMAGKFVDGMPLYRLEKHFERLGVELPRQIMSNWMLKGAESLEIIYNRMHEELCKLDIAHADESSLQVLREPGRSAKSKSFMWLYRSGRGSPPIVLYDYQPTRSGIHARNFLGEYKGYVHVDGYGGYGELKQATLVGCWAHARRGFVEALAVVPAEHRNDPSHLSNIALSYIGRLYAIERDLADATAEQRKAGRNLRSVPILNEFKAWLDRESALALPKSRVGQAITYCRNQWSKLIRYVDDGRLEIDNNRAERSIKPFVISRKNWLFANTPRGAKASAIIYSIVESAKENGLNPTSYLEYVLKKLPDVDAADQSAIESLLPWNEDLQAALTLRPNATSS